MAEARVAANIHGVDLLEAPSGKCSTFKIGLSAWRISLVRSMCHTSNAISNGIWPTKFSNLVVTTGAVSLLLWRKPRFSTPLFNACVWLTDKFTFLQEVSPYIRVPIVSFTFGLSAFIVFLYVRRYTLRMLLGYRGWMYVPPKEEPYKTIIWALLVRLVSANKPRLYSYQASLPRMNVPNLHDTMENLIESLKPCYGEDSKEIAEVKSMAREFENTIGPKLQRLLILKSWMSPNYVSDWWEKYAYLRRREPILINSNYYVMGQCYWQPDALPSARAAVYVHQMMLCRRRIERQELQPLLIRNTIPMCMGQYYRMYSTVRIPQVECDVIKHYHPKDSQHIVVESRGVWYHMPVYDSFGRLLSPKLIECLLMKIVADSAENPATETASRLASLTAWDRDSWAKAREAYFLCGSGSNREMLESIEKAAFVLSFVDESPETLTDLGKFCLHGDGKCIWADKSITVLAFANGRMAMNVEHSWADAPVIGHVLESILQFENSSNSSIYDDCGHIAASEIEMNSSSTLFQPRRLSLTLGESSDCGLSLCINTAYELHQKNSADIDIAVGDHNLYGKGVIKCFHVSPDAYIQLAICLAFYRCTGRFVLTYEATQTRLFLNGRTETVRSLTQESKDFVLAMAAENADRGLRIRLLRRACERHVKLYKDAMNGYGIDRHLFALYVACRGCSLESPLLNRCLQMPWTLSTSQQPQHQLENSPSCDLPEYRDKTTPGGGFGPVSDQGYGISYMVAGDFRIFFHVSSKRSCQHTDSTGFLDAIFESLKEMKALFDGQSQRQEQRRGSVVSVNPPNSQRSATVSSASKN